MRIEHVALYVRDLEAAREFWHRYFQAEAGERYHNPRTRFSSYFLSFPGGGTRLEIMTRPDVIERPKDLTRTGYAHVAISLGSREAVDQLTARLRADGYQVISGPRVTGDGYYESALLALEDNQVEITV